MIDDIRHLYLSTDRQFYRDQTVSKNPLRRWFHLNRYRIANSLVKAKYVSGKKIIDLGCGSCDWNIDNLSVFGIDLNEGLLRIGKQKNRLYEYKVADAADTGLASESFDIVTAFELLEHKKDYEQVIEESRRLLKNGGYCIISVPFDIIFSWWRPLFFTQVLFHGYVLQDHYYKSRCGHINHFSFKSIKEPFLKHGFIIDLVFDMRKFTIFLSAQKKPSGVIPPPRYDDVTIILPTLNEEGNILTLLSYLVSHYHDCSIIVADDGSSDGTKECVLNFADKKLIFLDRKNSPIHGLTASVLEAIELVKTPYFIVMDADGQHPPEKIEELANLLRLGSDLVIASRYAVEKKWGILRKIISYTGTLFGKASLLLRGKDYIAYDILGGFFGCNLRFWKLCLSSNRKSKLFRLRGYKVLFDFLKCAPRKVNIEETYYKFETRKSEVSKINPRIYLEFLKACFMP